MPACKRAQTPRRSTAWVDKFRTRALARGMSDATYTRVMTGLKPDTSVYALLNNQDEFSEQLWQYLNRRASDWRITAGKERAKQYAAAAGTPRAGLWRRSLSSCCRCGASSSSYGDVIDNPKYMRPVIPALAALAYGEPRRRNYWEAELLNALVIVDRGWSEPKQMIGSWAGAMGHTQWMPEVWLHIGVDYNKDGRISPFGPPDDAFAGTARYLDRARPLSPRRKLGLRSQTAGRFKRQPQGHRAAMRSGAISASRAPTAQPSRGRSDQRAAARAGRGRPGVPASGRISPPS